MTTDWKKCHTTPTVMLRPSLNILKRGLDNSALTFLWRSGWAGGLAFCQSLEVDRQRLLLWVWRTSVVLLGDHVAHDPPKTHKEDSQYVGQHPLWGELRVCGPKSKKTDREKEYIIDFGRKKIDPEVRDAVMSSFGLHERHLGMMSRSTFIIFRDEPSLSFTE